ncbi:uncharacterized protein IL334_007881 [Kwoniella shivajii]|uniref:Rab-GAP TBC domain-containing protein n=1 Tax=Kwoniella shivajii TaxID=564305 RepID=A0ABZ1D9X1_9TREE|nr:hypothetical protein IL334_007881 [Kwoniella shivajii]
MTTSDEVNTARHSTSSDSSSLINISSISSRQQANSPSSTNTSFEHVPDHAQKGDSGGGVNKGKKAKLLYCKSHVSIHPTSFNKDNISGYLGIVEVEHAVPHSLAPHLDSTAQNGGGRKTETLVTWVPDELLDRMDVEDREGYRRVEGRSNQSEHDGEEEDGFVFVSLPPPKGEKYAFSIPITSIYSILVYPPSLSHWYGSATFNLMGGISLPTLYFHDDESPLLATPHAPNTQQPLPRAQWGFPPFLSLLESRATVVRSRLLQSRKNMGAELWLVNPSKSDREVHEAGLEEEPEAIPPQRKPVLVNQPSEPPKTVPYPPKQSYPNTAVLNNVTPKQTLMTSLSNLTNLSRKAASQVLSHPLAQPVVPHLPPAVRSLVHVPGEWERTGRLPPKTGKASDVANEFESARLYLARWARVVAEEGEKARRDEIASQARLRRSSGSGSLSPMEDLESSLGVFSMLPKSYSKRPIPNPTRTPQHPITSRDWESFAAQGRDELYVRREIFKRGFTDSTESEEKKARREGWEVLLGIIPWSIGGLGGGELGKEKRKNQREEARKAKRQVYQGLKSKWKVEVNLSGGRDDWREEWHRIDVDCRRTDRNQSIYAVPSDAAKNGNHEKEGGGAATSLRRGSIADDGQGDEEEGGVAALNPHIAALRTILMTYHTYSPDLGYVQGMSDLLSPIYVVFDANEADSFWGLVGVMKMMESNFLRDQSGMKRKLSTLQQLISVMDPELYAHLERTDSLNLFFCFRWILISFKREFKFEQVIKLWEVLWTNHYSNQFILFVALAVLQSHRDVLIRYLTEFDEVLKYANDLSGTIDLDTTLAQAEVLFLSFKTLVEDLDKETQVEQKGKEGLRHRKTLSDTSGVTSKKEGDDSEENKKKERKVISEDLRELLNGWKE